MIRGPGLGRFENPERKKAFSTGVRSQPTSTHLTRRGFPPAFARVTQAGVASRAAPASLPIGCSVTADARLTPTKNGVKPAGTPTPVEEPLSAMMLEFLHEYLVDWHVTRAAIRAGYSKDTARQLGSRVINMPAAQRWLQAKLDERAAERAAMEQRIIDELEKVAYLDIEPYLNFDGTFNIEQCPPDVLAAISEIRHTTRGVVVKFASKLDALEKLARHTGKFNNKLELSGPGGGPIPLASVDMTPAEAAALWQQQLAES